MRSDEVLTDSRSPEGDPADGKLGILAVVWRKKWLFLFFAAVGSALGYLYFLRLPPIYQSTAQVMIIKRDMGVPGVNQQERTVSDDSAGVNMHSLLLKNPTIAARAIEKYHLSNLPSLHDSSNPIGKILGGLTVDCKSFGSTSILTLNYRGGNDQDCPQILAAIVKIYQSFLGDTYQSFSDETAKLISQASDLLLKQLQGKEVEYQEFRHKAPLLWKGEAGGNNLHEARMAEIEANRSRLMVLQTETRAKIDAIHAALEKGDREAIVPLIQSFIASRQAAVAVPGSTVGTGNGLDISLKSTDPAAVLAQSFRPEKLAALDDLAASLAIEEQLLLEEVGPDHPRVKAIRKKQELVQTQLAAATKGLCNAVDGKQVGKRVDFVAAYQDSLGAELGWQAKVAQALDKLFQEEREAARGQSEYQIRDEGFRTEIGRMQQLFTVVIKRLDEINLVKDAGGVKTDILLPPEPGKQVETKLAATVGAGGFLGALVAFGLIWLTEMIDKRFRTPEDVRCTLGVAILGHIPAFETKNLKVSDSTALAALSPKLTVVHNPKGATAEAFRILRTTLYFNAQAAGQKVIQVTSPNPGDGKTTISSNMALSMAESGKRVLLVDADFRRPRVQRLFGVQNTIGLRQVIDGEAEIDGASRATEVPNLWLMTSGGQPSNPAELLTTARFKDFLDVVREQYDLVIINTPPVLAVTDACVVAPRVDAVVLVIRLAKNSRDTAVHAVETLDALGAKILGVIVNGLVSGKGYGFGGYAAYGYGYSYFYKHKKAEYAEEYHDCTDHLMDGLA